MKVADDDIRSAVIRCADLGENEAIKPVDAIVLEEVTRHGAGESIAARIDEPCLLARADQKAGAVLRRSDDEGRGGRSEHAKIGDVD